MYRQSRAFTRCTDTTRDYVDVQTLQGTTDTYRHSREFPRCTHTRRDYLAIQTLKETTWVYRHSRESSASASVLNISSAPRNTRSSSRAPPSFSVRPHRLEQNFNAVASFSLLMCKSLFPCAVVQRQLDMTSYMYI